MDFLTINVSPLPLTETYPIWDVDDKYNISATIATNSNTLGDIVFYGSIGSPVGKNVTLLTFFPILAGNNIKGLKYYNSSNSPSSNNIITLEFDGQFSFINFINSDLTQLYLNSNSTINDFFHF